MALKKATQIIFSSLLSSVVVGSGILNIHPRPGALVGKAKNWQKRRALPVLNAKDQ